MAAEIKLFKTDSSPWGFRLTGGRDFGTPLTVLKVSVNSVAESAGLQVGDILVHINDVDCHSLSHKEAQDLILNSNNSIAFSVLRGSLNLPSDVIDRLTPLPLRDFKTPEPNALQLPLNETNDSSAPISAPEVGIEIIPIKDLEPDQLEELGLNPLPEDFLEKAKRDPSPMPEVRPMSRQEGAPDVLETLEQLGLEEMVRDIEKQKEIVFAPVEPEAATDIETEASGETEFTEKCHQEIAATEAAELDNVEAVSDEEFAEFISGQEEVLQAAEGKTALGVDFKKFEPQAEFLMKSQVFRTIEESEKLLTREERDQKKWTTFMQKPKGPKPKPRPKEQHAVLVQANALPASEECPPANEQARTGLYEIPSEEEFSALVRVPTPQEEPPRKEEETELETNQVKEQLRQEQQQLQDQFDREKELNPQISGEEKSDIELQLEEIKKQLEAIQQLPFEIQQHLALVQDQLNKIVQHRLHGQEESPSAPRPSMVEETGLLEDISLCELSSLPPLEESAHESCESGLQPQPQEFAGQEIEEKKEFKLRTEEDPPILPPPKKEKPRKKRPFLGLGPAPRPLVLPGGRRWRTPKDAYNDEFIAETLSAQAEIITGTTLGVNFRKYQPKPPNLQHLRDSSVYKMIHDLEDPDVAGKGLASRPAVVAALEDYRPKSTPAAI